MHVCSLTPYLLKMALAFACLTQVATSSEKILAQGEQPASVTATIEKTLKGRDALAAGGTQWTILPTEAYRGKQDDIFFISPSTGWYGNGAGKIFKTADSGTTWTLQLEKPGTYFRCIGFVNDTLGFAGNIGPGYFPGVTDSTPLYRTRNGGSTWEAVTTIAEKPIVGLCAFESVRYPFVNAGNLDYKTRLVATGRVGGPACFIYSDDLGETWKQTPLPDSATMAFDVHFENEKIGFIATATNTDVQESRAMIIRTEDGGATWKNVFIGSRQFELTWKFSFPTRETGYCTIQSYNPDSTASARFIAKTTDGGKSWTEIPLVDDHKVRQFGVAFVDENHGWVGAMPGGFETTDGGKSWQKAEFGNAVNKIRVLREGNQARLFTIGVKVATATVDLPKK